MSKELTIPNQLSERWNKLMELKQFDERIASLSLQYDDSYSAKPAPQSMELVADSRDKLVTLYHISLYRGKGFTKALVSDCITQILEKYLHVKRTMDSEMATATAELIAQRFSLMTPADIKLFVTKGVMNEYGPILDRVDANVILSWAGQYWEQMKNMIRLRQKNAEKDDPKVPVPAVIADLSEKLRVKESQKQVNKVTTEKHESMNEWYEKRGIDIEQRSAECASLGTIKTG